MQEVCCPIRVTQHHALKKLCRKCAANCLRHAVIMIRELSRRFARVVSGGSFGVGWYPCSKQRAHGIHLASEHCVV
jgi:hypothetical protein